MKKIIIFSIVIAALAFPVIAEDNAPEIPVFIPTRYNAMGGYHVTDTTDYFTIFANPAGIHETEAERLSGMFDVKVSNPEVALEVAKLGVSALSGDDMDIALEDFQANILASLEDGVNAGSEMIGPLALGSISNFEYGAFGWGLLSKVDFSVFLPTMSQLDANFGWDNMLQFTYAAPILNSDVHYLSAGVSAKGLFMLDAGLDNVAPLELLAGDADIANLVPLYTHYGFGFDVGLYYKFIDMVSAGIVWRDFLNFIWTDKYDMNAIADAVSYGEFPEKASDSFGNSASTLDIGVGIDVPVFALQAIITNLDVRLDYKDLISVMNPSTISRNPWLNLSVGTEITLIDFVSVRAGISDMYLNAGVGLRFGKTAIEFAMYGKELGLEPGSLPQLNAALSINKYY